MSYDTAAITDAIKDFPRAALSHRPTPIEDLPRLSAVLAEELGGEGPRLMIKRDDLTGLAMGGNKARPLEFIFGDAVSKGADQIVITGAIQSNYCRTASASAVKLGMSCHVQLEERVSDMGPTYYESGNVLLDKIFGATISHFHIGEDESAADRELEHIASEYEAKGKTPYIINLSPDKKPIGALGYTDAVREMLEQAEASGERIDAIVSPSGSATTHSGILVGLALAGADIPVYGICVRRDAVSQKARVRQITNLLSDMLGSKGKVADEAIYTNDSWLGEGYGKIPDSVHEAIRLAARTDAILTDPTYTGKSIAGFINLTRQGMFKPGQNVLYIHTGGHPGIFAYQQALEV